MVQYSYKRPDHPLDLRDLPGRTTIDVNNPPEVPARHESRLLSLPYEVRARILQFALPSDCVSWFPNSYHRSDHEYFARHEAYCTKQHSHPETFLGCTNLLLVCSQIYHETIERLHLEEKVIELSGRYKQVLRGPLEFAKPGYFRGYKATTRCYIPKEHDGLQVMRFRKVLLHITFPDILDRFVRWRWDGKREFDRILGRLTENIAEVAGFLAKSKDLEVIRIVLDRVVEKDQGDGAGDDNDDEDERKPLPKRMHAAMLKRLLRLVDAARQSGCRLIIQAHEKSAGASSSDEPLAEAVVKAAKEDGVDVRLELTSLPVEPSLAGGFAPGLSSSWDSDSWGSSSSTALDNARFEAPTTTTLDGSIRKFWDDRRLRIFFEQYEEPSVPAPPKRPYELVPECRTCYQLFGSWSELAQHLKRAPTHRRPFTPKTFNQVDKLAFHGTGERKCYTCARNFTTVKAFELHAKMWRHGRKGIVPKYQEDNWAWHRKWKLHEKINGWL